MPNTESTPPTRLAFAVGALTLAFALLLTLPAARVAAQEPAMPSPEEMQRMMAEHRRLGQPGPEHERLASLVGEWEVETTMWPEPGSEAMQLPAGRVEGEMLLGGRFLRWTTRTRMGETMVESIVLLGFDRRNDLYNMMAMDMTGTYWVTAAGEATDERTVVMSGTDWDGIVGGEQQYDFVLTWEDENTLVTEIVFKDAMHTRGGPPHKMVESRATRVSR